MKKHIKIAAALFSFITALLSFFGCSKAGTSGSAKAPSICVFIPGIMADSPTYAHVAEGVQKAVDEYNAKITDDSCKTLLYIMEAGTNQAEWASKITALCATSQYDVIISSNPSLPEIAEPIAVQFTDQKFIFLDAALEGNEQIYTVSYNQRDQAYISGYMAGLYSKTHKVGLIAAQEYPIMNNILYPFYAKGAQDAYAGTTCDFRIVGNWYDASKGSELADAMHADGIDMILPICGGASQGVISSAGENGMHIVWFDENGFQKAPGIIVSCCMTNQVKAAKETTEQYLEGKTPWGTVRTVGMKEGYTEFFDKDAKYIEYVNEEIRNKIDSVLKSLKDGTIVLPEKL